MVRWVVRVDGGDGGGGGSVGRDFARRIVVRNGVGWDGKLYTR